MHEKIGNAGVRQNLGNRGKPTPAKRKSIKALVIHRLQRRPPEIVEALLEWPYLYRAAKPFTLKTSENGGVANYDDLEAHFANSKSERVSRKRASVARKVKIE